MNASSIAALADPHVFLVGRPPMGEYLGFFTTKVVGGDRASLAELAEAWRNANDHVLELQTTEADYADNPAIQPLPRHLAELGRKALADPIVQRSFALVPIEIGLVELDRVVVWQKHIDLSHIERLHAILGPEPTDEDVFRFCLPFDRRFDPPMQQAQIAQNAWGFLSPSDDLRVLGARLLDPNAITDLDPSGVATAVVALVVGYGSNYLSAIRADNRLVLNNGSHRAYALRDAGITHVPCLIQKVSRRDELDVIASGDLASNPDAYLSNARPPVLKDYFDEQLRMIGPVARDARQVRVAFNSESVDVPSA